MKYHLRKALSLLLPTCILLVSTVGCQNQSENVGTSSALAPSPSLPVQDTAQENQEASAEAEPGSSSSETVLENQDTQENQGNQEAQGNQGTQENQEASGQTDGAELLIPSLSLPRMEVPDTEGLKFVRGLKAGWNLGNTFDAIREGEYLEDDLSLESAWVGVKTTEEMIEAVKEAGFNTLRLPVSWHNHLTDTEFTISDAWLNRVQEVVDYAVKNDLYVILNTHHDVGQDYYYPTKAYLESSEKFITAIWAQLAERFADYDEHLIFESMNEPRMTGTDYEWWLDMNQAQCREAVECINQLNQVFLDTVRSAGGYNGERYLMVPAYSAAPENAANEAFQLPSDPAKDRLIVSVHAYKPYSFALQAPEEKGSRDTFDPYSPKDTEEIDTYLDMVYKRFVVNGIPVVIGEFGARDKGNNLQSRVGLAAYFTAYAAARGIPCIWWDNHAFAGSGENFGLLDRRTNTWRYPEIVAAIMEYAIEP